jgi:acetyl esterase/lipase
MRLIFPICFLLLLVSFTATGQPPMVVPLYNNSQIPNALPAENREKTEILPNGIEFTTETSIPTLTIFQPKNPNGKALIICPGGGYWGTAGDHEGRKVAAALNNQGITAFVLKYRVPDERTCVDPSLAPLQDAQQAIRWVRQNAEKWHVNPHKIGILGFSAGGHLAATAATHFNVKADPNNTDTTAARPDFVVLVYPVISFDAAIGHRGSIEKLLGKNPSQAQRDFFSCEKHVSKDTPPSFLVHAQDDDLVLVENSTAFERACTQAGVPVSLNLYEKGGHGFGMDNPTTDKPWMDALFAWLKQW